LQLVAEDEDYGYSIVLRLQSRGLSDLGEGTVYPALTRLEANGLLRSKLVRSASGPARKYYSITHAGMAELVAGVASWHAFSEIVAGILPGKRRVRSTP
jgi:PadR family transcriptional regulator PadR